eukprot:1826194-Pyramimonas_sp.AAC.1
MCAAASRMEGGAWSKCGSRSITAHLPVESLQQLRGFVRWCSGTAYGCKDATATSNRSAEAPEMMLWHDVGPQGHNSRVDSRR